MIRSILISGVAATQLLLSQIAMAELTPREQAERAAQQAMARAMAEKARNDAIVERQRAAEREAAKARQDTENFERACRRARTC
jgi:hypothetical protein